MYRMLRDDGIHSMHLDDLRPYYSRDGNVPVYRQIEPYFMGDTEIPAPAYHSDRSVMTHCLLLGQRSLDLRWRS
jgi:hypothetical protein